MRTNAPTTQPISHDPTIRITSPAWREYFQKDDDYYLQVLRWTDPTHPEFGKVEPLNPLYGLMAFANGVEWSPLGTGVAGYVWWNGTLWGAM